MYDFQTPQQPELIRDMSPALRPLSRLQSAGAEALREGELLSLLLHSRSVQAAQELLDRHPLKDLWLMPFRSLARMRGVGEAGAGALLAAAELSRRAENRMGATYPVIRTAEDLAAQAIEIRDKQKEYLLAFFLNARHQLVGKATISIGTLTASLASPREIFAAAVGNSRGVAGICLAHNHPSGDPSPSDEDVRLTKRIAQAGAIMGIDLLDHLIVAESGCYSFKSQSTGGLL